MPISGPQAIKILEKHGFTVSRQRGSHVVLTLMDITGKHTAVIPNHKELRKGTLRSIARQSGVDPKELGL